MNTDALYIEINPGKNEVVTCTKQDLGTFNGRKIYSVSIYKGHKMLQVSTSDTSASTEIVVPSLGITARTGHAAKAAIGAALKVA